MSDNLKALIVLPVLAILASLLVAGVHSRLGDAEVRNAGIQEALRSQMPVTAIVRETADNRLAGGRYWIGSSAGTTVGYAFIVMTSGFNGPIKTLATIDTGGALIGITVLSHREPPGTLGTLTRQARPPMLWSIFSSQAPFNDRSGIQNTKADTSAVSTALTSAVHKQALACLNRIKDAKTE
jgi:Na+-translocating ferredoxin:NAD+ oxidoreductase RnfG subunit